MASKASSQRRGATPSAARTRLCTRKISAAAPSGNTPPGTCWAMALAGTTAHATHRTASPNGAKTKGPRGGLPPLPAPFLPMAQRLITCATILGK